MGGSARCTSSPQHVDDAPPAQCSARTSADTSSAETWGRNARPTRTPEMTWRAVLAPEAAKAVQSLAPDLKRSVKAGVRAIVAEPQLGKALVRELSGLYSYRVRRYRIVYACDNASRTVRIVAVGHRESIYEDLALP